MINILCKIILKFSVLKVLMFNITVGTYTVFKYKYSNTEIIVSNTLILFLIK